jgi:hypothetical protein
MLIAAATSIMRFYLNAKIYSELSGKGSLSLIIFSTGVVLT